jgi:hypothetical protein
MRQRWRNRRCRRAQKCTPGIQGGFEERAR